MQLYWLRSIIWGFYLLWFLLHVFNHARLLSKRYMSRYLWGSSCSGRSWKYLMKNLSALSLSPSLTAPPFKMVTHGSLQVWKWGVKLREEVVNTQELWCLVSTHCASTRLHLSLSVYCWSRGIPFALTSTSLGKKFSLSMSSQLLSPEYTAVGTFTSMHT